MVQTIIRPLYVVLDFFVKNVYNKTIHKKGAYAPIFFILLIFNIMVMYQTKYGLVNYSLLMFLDIL